MNCIAGLAPRTDRLGRARIAELVADRDRHGAEEAAGASNVVPLSGDRGWKARALRSEALFEELVQRLRRFRAELIEWVSRELPK